MDAQVFYLEPHSAFHFGLQGVGLEAAQDYCPSDTLFSALCITSRFQHGVNTLVEMLELFRTAKPPFLISGAFPYLTDENGERIRFYPAPASIQMETEKVLRKARWISHDIFHSWLNTGKFPIQNLADDAQIPSNILLTKAEFQRLPRAKQAVLFWAIDTVDRVTVDRVNSASEVYRAGRLRFPEGGGLWLAAYQVANTKFNLKFLEEQLNLLSDEGLGGERASGYGQFTLFTESSSFPDVKAGKLFLSLAHYFPNLEREQAQFASDKVAYQWIKRRGFMGSPEGQRIRKRVSMIQEGAVLNASDSLIYGQIVDVAPDIFRDHPVYRYGYAFPIGLGGS